MPTDLLAANNSAPQDLFAQNGINVAPSFTQNLQNEWNNGVGTLQAIGAGLGNGLGGIATAGQQLGNLGVRGINALTGSNLPQNTTNYQNQFSGPQDPTIGQKLLQGAASFVPYATGGEMAIPGRILGSGLLGTVAKLGTTGFAYNQTMNPNPTLMGDLGGAAANIVAAAPGAIFSKGLNSLAANQTPEQLAANVASAQGTNTGLGAILNSPSLQFAQKIGMNVPFSGGQGIKSNITDQITQNGQDLLNNLSGGVAPQDVGGILQNGLKSQLGDLQSIKTQNYSNLNNLAQQAGLQISRDNMAKTAQDTLSAINSSDELKSALPKPFVNEIQNFASPSNTVTTTDPIVGTKVTNAPNQYSLQDSNIFRSILEEKANDAYFSGNNYIGGVYNKMKGALTNDIQDAITNSNNPAIKQEYDNSQNFYAQNIAPWEEPAIAKYAKFGGDPDTLISSFVKPGAVNDRGNLISSLINKLPPAQQSLPLYAYLSRANIPDPVTGQLVLNPQKLSQLWNGLGANTKDALAGVRGTPQREQIEQYNNLVGMNKPILNANVANSQHKNIGWEAIAAAVAEHHYGLPATAGMAVGLAGTSAITNRLLTSPGVRNAAVNLIKNRALYEPNTITRYSGGLGVAPLFINPNQGQ